MKLSTIVSAYLIFAVSNVYADTKKENVSLDEVIITGEKLEKSLQETVTSIQVFNETDFLNTNSLNDMYDIFEQSTNVNRQGKYGFNIRGINSTGISGSYIGPRTINVSVDGVSQASNASKQGAISTWDVKQVEILKGPQSTTQGRNSLAGAVVVKTNDPEFEANTAAQASYGTNNTYQLSAMQTGAITDNLAIRLSVDQQHSDGFVTNENIRGDKFNERDITNVRGKFLYKFDEDSTALLTLSKLIYDDAGHNRTTKDRKSVYNTDGHYDTKAVSHSLEINHALNDRWNLKSITSYTDETLDRVNDLDKLDGNAIGNFDRENDSVNQEFRFSYDGDSSKSIIGFYHSQGKGVDNRSIEDLAFTSSVQVDYQQYLEEEYSNTALFFNTDYYLTDKFTFIFGARLDRDTRKNISTIDAQRLNDLGSAAANNAVDNQLAALANGDISDKNSTTNFLPKIGFNYKWNDNINTGFVFSQGYRPGGVSVNPITARSTNYDKEFTNNFELSFKSEWLDKRLIFNTNLFYTAWKDQQVLEQGTSGSPFDTNTINAGKSSLKGIEFNTKYKITNELDFYGNLGLIKATYDDYKTSTNDYSGNEILKTPNVTANLGLNYRNNQGYFVGGNINFTGSSYGDSANERKIDSYHIVNLKAGYEAKDWAVYAYANNLFDKDYALNNYGDGEYEMGDERVIGINLKYYW